MNKPMTKHRISQYCKHKKEIEALRGRISSIEKYPDIDFVQASDGAGWQKKEITVKGFGNRQLPRLYERMRNREAECHAIEEFVDSIEDGTIWQLLTHRYIEGRTIKETAALVNYSQSRVKQFLSEFCERLPKDEQSCTTVSK